MTLIENIGPLLGLVAFVGFCGFLVVFFQQAREVRRLRDWAGRAPERAAAAAEREERVASLTREEDLEGRGPLSNLRVDPLIIGVALGALLIALGIFSNGFGILDEEPAKKGGKQANSKKAGEGRSSSTGKPTVVVLNATQPGEGLAGTPGVADRVSAEIPGGSYKTADPTDAPIGFASSTIMYAPGDEQAAVELADNLVDVLGRTLTEPMTPEIEQAVGSNVGIVVLVGLDDASIALTPSV